MPILGYLVLTLARVLQLLINLYSFVVAIAVLMSWIQADPYNPIVRLLHQVTEPAFSLARRFIPTKLYRFGIDFAPIVVFILLIAVDTIVVNLLFDFAHSLLR